VPSKSKAEQRLMAAAAHGATFPKAQQVRQSMTLGQLHDFAKGSMQGKPDHVRPQRHRMAGSHAGGHVTEHHRPARRK
jgi:hypothetical protein